MSYTENHDAAFASTLTNGTVPRWQRKAMETLSSGTPQADRFIPARSSTSIEEGHFLLTNAEDDEVSCSPSKVDYRRAMASSLFPDNSKVLAFSQAAPKPREGHQGEMNVLYSQSRAAAAARKTSRYIPQNPDRILDAPEMRGDFYLNTLDWSSSNVIAVALGQTVYLWNAGTGAISELCSQQAEDDYISSVSWLSDGVHVAVGTASAQVQIWDVQEQRKIRTMTGHGARVAALSWNEHMLSSGSKTGAIFNSDVRIQDHCVATLRGHTQEVCGLRWSPDGKHLASGGNDNVVNIWNANGSQAHSLTQHTAAVKALAWCPWQSGVLATGGGTADRQIRVWNANTGACISSVDARSQVSALLWNREHRELVSGHGHAQNQLTLWKYPSLTRAAELTGHTQRVLNMAMSPDGQTVVSAGADETLRFWKCFASDGKQKVKTTTVSASRLTAMIR